MNHRTLIAMSALAVALSACTAELDMSTRDPGPSPGEGETTPGQTTPTPDPDPDPEPDPDPDPDPDPQKMGALEVRSGGVVIEPMGTIELGSFEVGQADACAPIELLNTGDAPVALDLTVSTSPVTLEAAAPAALAAGASAVLTVCVDTGEVWSGAATLTNTLPALSITLTAVVAAPDPIVAVLASGGVAVSSDRGITWDDVALPDTITSLRGGAYLGDHVWVFGEGATPLLKSRDGRAWEPVDVAGAEAVRGIAFGEGKYMAVAPRSVLTSSDGERFALDDAPFDRARQPEREFTDVAFGDGKFVAVGLDLRAVSTDGLTFETLTWDRNKADRVVFNGEFFARTTGGYVEFSANGLDWNREGLCSNRGPDGEGDIVDPLEREIPSQPVVGPMGIVASGCDGRTEITHDGDELTRVGPVDIDRPPMLFAKGMWFGADAEGFWRSPDLLGRETTRLEGGADVVAMVYMGAPERRAPAPERTCDTLMCADFEGEIGEMPPLFQGELRVGDENIVAVDQDFAFEGTGSMRVEIRADEGGQRGMMRYTGDAFPEALRDGIHARMMVYIETYPVRNWHFAEGNGPLGEFRSVAYNAGGEDDRAFHNYFGAGGDCWNKSNATYPAGQWFCWQVHMDRLDDTMVISVDGQEVHRMDGKGQGCLGQRLDADSTWVAPNFQSFNIGFNPFKTQEQSFSAWIDAIAVDDEPIACPNIAQP